MDGAVTSDAISAVFAAQCVKAAERRVTFGYAERRAALEKLTEAVRRYEPEILAAFAADFGKPEAEVVFTEILPVTHEIRHTLNFIEAIRGKEKLNAEIEIGHLSAALCHLGNIATRLRRSLRFDPQSEKFLSPDGSTEDAETNELVGRKYRNHWGTPVG